VVSTTAVAQVGRGGRARHLSPPRLARSEAYSGVPPSAHFTTVRNSRPASEYVVPLIGLSTDENTCVCGRACVQGILPAWPSDRANVRHTQVDDLAPSGTTKPLRMPGSNLSQQGGLIGPLLCNTGPATITATSRSLRGYPALAVLLICPIDLPGNAGSRVHYRPELGLPGGCASAMTTWILQCAATSADTPTVPDHTFGSTGVSGGGPRLPDYLRRTTGRSSPRTAHGRRNREA